MHAAGKDPLTWSFVKLFGVQIRCDLHEFEGMPASHAWRWKSKGIWRTRLQTKAQCCGVVTSILMRSDRAELLVDDGTAPVKAVLWGEGIHIEVALGDLIRIEGKLNMDKNWDAAELSRELRILRIYKLRDPDEELLHWAQAMELEQAYYSAEDNYFKIPAEANQNARSKTQWEAIAAEAFFSLSVDPGKKQQFLEQRDCDLHDDTLSEILDVILHQQKTCGAVEATKLRFSDLLFTNGEAALVNKNSRIRALQHVFRKLRRAGLLFLEDNRADQYILLSFEFVLKPALLELLRGHPLGRSIPEIAAAIWHQERFKCIPLEWIETSIEVLVASQMIIQGEDFQLYFVK
ncbi:hypothetical protein Plhal703r1_c04g0023521 [Plasmopara halstedii]